MHTPPRPQPNNRRGPLMPRVAAALLALALTTPLAAQEPIIIEQLAEGTAPPPVVIGPKVRIKTAWLGLIARPDAAGRGLTVASVPHGYPAYKAKLQPDDLLTHINDNPVTTLRQLKSHLSGLTSHSALRLKVRRGAQELTPTLYAVESPPLIQLHGELLTFRELLDFPLLMVEGGQQQTRPISALRGKPIVIEMWGTWCGPCRALTPALNAIKQRHGDKLHVIAISDEPLDLQLKDAMETKKLFSVAQDTTRFAHESLLVRSFPTVYIIDEDFKIEHIVVGGKIEEINYYVEKVMAKK